MNLKKIFSYAATIFFVILNSYTFSGLDEKNQPTVLPVVAANQSETENESEENDAFSFIKSNEEVMDFFYDGSLLLYGGIALIVVSFAGIIITFIPRKRRKKRKRK